MTVDRGNQKPNTGVIDDRLGQSEAIGFVLVFSLMIVGAIIVVGIGSTAVDDTEDQLSDQRAEKAMTQFSSKAGLVALQEADTQQVDFATDQDEQFGVVEDTGWMDIAWKNQTTGYSEQVMNITLGAVVYEGANTRMAYQGGGVFRSTTQGGQMISPPEFHFRDGTLTLPAINVTGDAALGNSATVTRRQVDRRFPTGVGNSTNPLDNHVVTVTVNSEYYRGWGEYFEERTDGEVEYDDANETATLLMVTPIEITEITAASSSLAASGDFIVDGKTPRDRFTDSYNSSEGPYDPLNPGKAGDLIYSGDIDLSSGSGNSDFWGDIEAGGDVTVGTGGGQPDVNGNISHGDLCLPSPADCDNKIIDPNGEVTKIDDIRTAGSVTWFVNNSISELEEEADESNPTLADGTELDNATYYFDSFVVNDGDEIEINTTENDVKIGVRENVDIGDQSRVNVTGDGIVRLFVGGEGIGGSNELQMRKEAEILTPGDDATMFRLYGKEDFRANIGNSGKSALAKFVGVLYAPPGIGGNGEIVLDSGEVFGGMLTGTTTIEKGSIHYDEALRGTQVIPPNANQVKVTFLHVTVNEIAVKD